MLLKSKVFFNFYIFNIFKKRRNKKFGREFTISKLINLKMIMKSIIIRYF